jgi:thioredoxin 1
MATASVTNSTFSQEVLQSSLPVLVDFWAPWCGPCRVLTPIVDELSDQYSEQLRVVKINTDENPEIATHYGIRSIPTLILFQGGQPVDRVVGVASKTTLTNTIEKHF